MGKINLGKKTLGRSESFKNMKEVERGKMRKTIQNIKGTPAEFAADKKRAASKTVKVSKPERKPKRNPEASSKDYTGDIKEFLRIKKSKGGKVSSRGRGMGKALRGGGKVMI